MDGAAGTVAIIAVVVLVGGIVLLVSGRVYTTRRTESLRRQFGSEYDRVIEDHGGRRRGERELRSRLRDRNALTIRQLEPNERARFTDAWESAQATFVDTPATGLRDADLLVMQVMRERGYPVEHFHQRARLISVDHPDLVEHFRAAHTIAVANEDGSADTEQIRQAMVDYRFLFDELVQGGGPERTRRS